MSTTKTTSHTSLPHAHTSIQAPWCPLCSDKEEERTQNDRKANLMQKVQDYLDGKLIPDSADTGLFSGGSLAEALENNEAVGGSHRWRKYCKTMKQVNDKEPGDLKTIVEYETRGEVSKKGLAGDPPAKHFTVTRSVTTEVDGQTELMETCVWDSEKPDEVQKEGPKV